MKIGNVRVSRPCYDKYHRCPGWAGAGMRYNKRDWCEGGSLAPFGGAYYKEDGTLHGKHWRLWRVNRCPQCGTYVLPYHVRWLDWRWLRFWTAWHVSDWWLYRLFWGLSATVAPNPRQPPAIGDLVEDCAYKVQRIVGIDLDGDTLTLENGMRCSWRHCCDYPAERNTE